MAVEGVPSSISASEVARLFGPGKELIVFGHRVTFDSVTGAALHAVNCKESTESHPENGSVIAHKIDVQDFYQKAGNRFSLINGTTYKVQSDGSAQIFDVEAQRSRFECTRSKADKALEIVAVAVGVTVLIVLLSQL